ncbi:hypothetical protein JW921_09835, partial [Candidatus Fermentibacterales bacterium]|nr:hypothetical protein [Candidatus Fermentibacterales bacterium]
AGKDNYYGSGRIRALEAVLAALALGTGPEPPTRPAGLRMRVCPSPARESATVRLELAEPAAVRVTILDLSGRVVSTLHEGPLPAGGSDLLWTAGPCLPPGAYFALANCDGENESTLFVLLSR